MNKKKYLTLYKSVALDFNNIYENMATKPLILYYSDNYNN